MDGASARSRNVRARGPVPSRRRTLFCSADSARLEWARHVADAGIARVSPRLCSLPPVRPALLRLLVGAAMGAASVSFFILNVASCCLGAHGCPWVSYIWYRFSNATWVASLVSGHFGLSCRLAALQRIVSSLAFPTRGSSAEATGSPQTRPGPPTSAEPGTQGTTPPPAYVMPCSSRPALTSSATPTSHLHQHTQSGVV